MKIDIEDLQKIVEGKLSFLEYASTHTLAEVEYMSKQLAYGEQIGKKTGIISDINVKVLETAMAIDTQTNPRGLMELKEKLEKI